MALCSLGTGCFSASPEAEARLAQVKAQGEQFEAQLDTIEERLLGNQAMVHQWQELGRRHRQVSAVTCENLMGHVEGMEKFIAKQEAKSRRIRRARLQAQANASGVSRKGRRSRNN